MSSHEKHHQINGIENATLTMKTTPTIESDNTSIICPFGVARDAINYEIDLADKRMTSGDVLLNDIIENGSLLSSSSHPDGLTNNTNSQITSIAAITPLTKLFTSETNRIATYIINKRQSLSSSARSLLLTCDALLNRGNNCLLDPAAAAASAITKRQSIDNLRRAAWDISKESMALNKFLETNRRVLRLLGQSADERLVSTSFLSRLDALFGTSPWNSGDGIIITILSDIYDVIRDAECSEHCRLLNDSSSLGQKWVAPHSFERQTHKYFVPMDKIPDVLHTLVQKAPLLTYGHQGRLTPKFITTDNHNNNNSSSSTNGDYLWDTLVTPITSIYFDTADMALYQTRLMRDEGAQLFRIRWYGDQRQSDNDHNDDTNDDTVVFLELKTHHEKWVNAKSMKERVTIRHSDVRHFLTSSPSEWDLNHAKTLLARADNSLSHQEMTTAAARLLKMHRFLHERKLYPCVRTVYRRAAFQSCVSNSLRLTLDRDITMIDERAAAADHGRGGRDHDGYEGDWCYKGDDRVPMTSITKLSHAILEVKIGGDGNDNADDAGFVETLIANGTISDAHKFSKYLTGAAAFNDVDTMPYWADIDGINNVFRHVSNPAAAAGAAKIKRRPLATPPSNNHHTNDVIATPIPHTPATCTPNDPPTSSSNKPRPYPHSIRKTLLRHRRRRQYHHPFKRRHPRITTTTTPSIAPSNTARVEPKSYFANERTYIQWISASAMIFAIGSFLLTTNSPNDDNNDNAWIPGIVLMAISMIVVIHAMHLYFKRIDLLQSRNTTGYAERLGPMVLGVSILIGVALSLAYTQPLASSTGGGGVVEMTAEVGECARHGTKGISSLRYQPSGIVYDRRMGVLLIPSLTSITALNQGETMTTMHSNNNDNNDDDDDDNDVHIVADIRGENFEDIVIVHDTIYALSESDTHSKLVAFRWNDTGRSSNVLNMIDEWIIPTPGAEGLAFVVTEESGEGVFYIAGDVSALERSVAAIDPKKRAVIDAYDVPTVTTTMYENDNNNNKDDDNDGANYLSPLYAININTMRYDLNDDDKISSMQFFEGVLYVLHDNSEVIRAWDIDEGRLLAEWNTPRVPEGFGKQWEGLFFRWVDVRTFQELLLLLNNDESTGDELLLSSSLSSSSMEYDESEILLLHLALDSSPQIWTVVISSGDHPFNFTMPSCSGMKRTDLTLFS